MAAAGTQGSVAASWPLSVALTEPCPLLCPHRALLLRAHLTFKQLRARRGADESPRVRSPRGTARSYALVCAGADPEGIS